MADFGFWLEGSQFVPGGLFSPFPGHEYFCAKEPISFAVYMPAETQQTGAQEVTIINEESRAVRLLDRSEGGMSAGLPAVRQGGAAGVEIEKRMTGLVQIRRHR